jgi:SAM-dependent methyltransferase
MAERAGYEHEFFEPLARLEPHSFWFRARNRLIVRTVRRHFPGARSLLEVGCGTGFVLTALHAALPGVRLVGSELFAEGLAVARPRLPSEVELIQLDATRMSFRGEFDVVGAFDVLEHIADDVAALAGIHRALAPGGGVVLLVPQHPRLWSEADAFARHERRYTRAGLVGKVERAGFEVVAVSSWMTTLLPAMVAARLLARLRPRSYDPVRELRPGALNRLFERLLDGETALIGRGVDLPAGGSLLLVGRRV